MTTTAFDGPNQASICMHNMVVYACEELAVFRDVLHVMHVLLCIAVGNGSCVIVRKTFINFMKGKLAETS